jgi:hypothetical protein
LAPQDAQYRPSETTPELFALRGVADANLPAAQVAQAVAPFPEIVPTEQGSQ